MEIWSQENWILLALIGTAYDSMILLCHNIAVGATPATSNSRLCLTSKVHSSVRWSLAASDVQFHRDPVVLHAALGSNDREKEEDTLQVL